MNDGSMLLAIPINVAARTSSNAVTPITRLGSHFFSFFITSDNTGIHELTGFVIRPIIASGQLFAIAVPSSYTTLALESNISPL